MKAKGQRRARLEMAVLAGNIDFGYDIQKETDELRRHPTGFYVSHNQEGYLVRVVLAWVLDIELYCLGGIKKSRGLIQATGARRSK